MRGVQIALGKGLLQHEKSTNPIRKTNLDTKRKTLDIDKFVESK